MGTRAHFPALEKLPPRNDDGASIFHISMPWWGYRQQAQGQLDFPRGYHLQPYGKGALSTVPEMSIGGDADYCKSPYGAALREQMRRRFGGYFYFGANGEMIPNEGTYIDVDPRVKDKWGIPVVRFHWKWGDYELRQLAHQRWTYRQVIE